MARECLRMRRTQLPPTDERFREATLRLDEISGHAGDADPP
jgi:hypothetical protein